MLLGETTRQFRLDEDLIYGDSGSIPSTSWTTLRTYNINASGNELFIYSFIITTGTGSTGSVRLLIDNTYIIGGEANTSGGTVATFWGYFTLPAGQHTIAVQGRYSGTSASCTHFHIRRFFFNDFSKIDPRGSGEGIINIPQRKTCLGQFKNVPVYILCYAETTPTLTIDGASVSWTSTTGFKYVWSGGLTPGSHTINVNTGYYVVVACPWLLPSGETEILDVDVPMGSTIYITAVDLALNGISKTIALGRRMRIPTSTGSTLTPYIWSTSGTSYVVSGSYTFEFFQPKDLPLVAFGLGGAIAYIGVDVRT